MNPKNRKLSYWMDDDVLIIEEKTSYTPSGGTNRKWDEARIQMTLAELEAALAYMRKELEP